MKMMMMMIILIAFVTWKFNLYADLSCIW